MGMFRGIWAEVRSPEGRGRTLVTGAVVIVLAAGGGAAVAMQGSPVASVRSGPPATTTTTQPPVVPTTTNPTTTTSPPSRVQPAATPVSLVAYGGCSQLLTQVKTEALAEVGPYGLAQAGGYGGYRAVASSGAAPAGGAPEAAPAASGSGASGSAGAGNSSSQPAGASPSYSGTNNQEAGVDEPDLTKTDGHLLLVVRHSPVGLEVADVSKSTPQLDGFIALPQVGYDPQLLVTGGYAVIIGQGHWDPSSNQAGTEVDVVSLSDPSHLSVTRSFDLQG
ncbi:MAG: beta-propeller domain-containing protein, partial [Acidimicrobiales bacterium]